VREEVSAFAAPLGFETLDVLPGSALRGDMVVGRGAMLDWFAGPTLLERLEALDSGVEQAALAVRDHLQIVRGRMFDWGKNEVIVGAGAVQEFAGLDVGSKIKVGRYEWPVVGIFSANGAVAESEIWTDAKVLQDAYNRAIQDCDVFVMLFRTKVGKYTAEEFGRAFGQFQGTGKPRIYTYFNKVSVDIGELAEEDFLSLKDFQKRLKSLGHFQTVYENPEGLLLHFGEQLEKLYEAGAFGPTGGVSPDSAQPPPSPRRKLQPVTCDTGRNGSSQAMAGGSYGAGASLFGVPAAGSFGSMERSIAPVVSLRKRTLFQLLPPSVLL